MSYEFKPPANLPENKRENKRVVEIIQQTRNALTKLIAENKNLNSVSRYVLIRPLEQIKDVIKGRDPGETLEECGDWLVQFCRRMDEPYPKTREEKEALLHTLDSQETKTKILSRFLLI